VRQLPYCLLQALRGIARGPLVQLAAIGSVAVGLLLVGGAVLGASNLSRLTERWGRGIQVIAYLKPDATEPRLQRLASLLRNRPEVLGARLVSPAEAHRRLAESLGARRSLLAGVDAEFLPASFEISLAEDRPHQVRALLALLSSSPAVEEVDYMGSWARRLGSLAALLKLGSLALALLMGLACLYVVGSTIRLGVHARREEIEIIKLVGATDRFVRAPFLVEGLLQGLLGATLAAGLLYALNRATAPPLERVVCSATGNLSHLFIALHLQIKLLHLIF
jgi:cell division transport system permease protein